MELVEVGTPIKEDRKREGLLFSSSITFDINTKEVKSTYKFRGKHLRDLVSKIKG